jgi:hypothetical protein
MSKDCLILGAAAYCRNSQRYRQRADRVPVLCRSKLLISHNCAVVPDFGYGGVWHGGAV